MHGERKSFNKKPKPLKFLFFLGIAALFVIVLGSVVMFLWNAILPRVTGVKAITYWEAVGLFVLAKILFGGFGPGRFGKRRWGHRRNKWRNKWKHMNQEERAHMKAKWEEYCSRKKGGGPEKI